MINNTTLVGRLTKNPELKYTGSGIAVVSFSLAVERNYTNAQGERETDFIMCQAWRGTAETLSSFAVKGSLIGITGSIQTRNYQNNEGQTIYITEAVVNNFQMLEPKEVTDNRRSQSGQQGGYSGQGNVPSGQQNNGMGQSNYKNNGNSAFESTTTSNENPFETTDNVADIKDDDLPF